MGEILKKEKIKKLFTLPITEPGPGEGDFQNL